MNSIQEFKFEGNPVRIFKTEDGEFEFVAKDVCDILEIDDVSKVMERIDADEKLIRKVFVSGQNRDMWLVNESGLYAMVLRSIKPEAHKFRKWITSDVLPSIRKHGVFMTPEKIEEVLSDPDVIINIATQLKEEREKRLALQAKVEEDRPKVEFAEAVNESVNTISISELAKLIKKSGVDMGRDRLFKQLRKDGFIVKYGREPTQRSLIHGFMEVKEDVYEDQRGFSRVSVTPRVTGKGQRYFVGRYAGVTLYPASEV